jgi:hypothetical protein
MQKLKIKYAKIHKCILNIRIGAVGFLNWWLSIDQYFVKFCLLVCIIETYCIQVLFDGYIRTVHINIELKAESNKVISVLA